MDKSDKTVKPVKTESSDMTPIDKRANKNAPKPPKIKFRYYLLLMFLTFLARAFFGGRSKKTEAFKKQKKSGAMLVLSNHVSNPDFIHMSPPMLGAKINFVVAEHMLYTAPIFKKLITGYGAITKKQFYSDFQCIKSIKRNLDAGISVMLCPEGKVSSDGTTGYISESTARLIKWLGYPVGTVIINGAGLVNPKWAYTLRRGKIIAQCDMLFSKEDVEKLSKQEIYSRVLSALDHSEYRFQTENGLRYRGKRYAEGLERILFRCPKCGAEFTLSTKGDTIKCSDCENTARLLNTGIIVPVGAESAAPERVDLWYALQRRVYAEKVALPDFSLEDTVELYIENESRSGHVRIAKGVLRLDNTSISFTPDPESANETEQTQVTADSAPPIDKLSFPTAHFATLASVPGRSIDLYDDAHTYRFVFGERKSSTAYVVAIESMAEKR